MVSILFKLPDDCIPIIESIKNTAIAFITLKINVLFLINQAKSLNTCCQTSIQGEKRKRTRPYTFLIRLVRFWKNLWSLDKGKAVHVLR